MINYNNHDIKYMSYNGHMIKRAYGCDARLVWEEDSHHDYSGDYFTIVCKSGRVSIKFIPDEYVAEKRIYAQWGNKWLPRTSADTINLVAGETAVLKGNLRHQGSWVGAGRGVGSFVITTYNNGKVEVEGNILSLRYGDNFTGNTMFDEEAMYKNLFINCTPIVSAKNLVLPNMVKGSCYHSMFKGCSNLTTAPDLNAEELAALCYYGMFSGCTNLNYIKCLATGDLSGNYTDLWVSGVQTVGGTFVKKAGVEWPDWTVGTGSDGIPKNWTVIEEGLVGKWKVTYADSRVFSAECDSTSAITSGEVTKENLVQIEIGECVTSIGDSAFSNASSLTSIKVWQTTPPTLGGTPFANTGNAPIYVPASSVDLYKNQWTGYASRIQPIQ